MDISCLNFSLRGSLYQVREAKLSLRDNMKDRAKADQSSKWNSCKKVQQKVMGAQKNKVSS